ncbi:hypothetical protein E4U61_006618 [Claviceps capensis]|nr:hypothetical protein E4U61_006618 [Claviceps capensis]
MDGNGYQPHHRGVAATDTTLPTKEQGHGTGGLEDWTHKSNARPIAILLDVKVMASGIMTDEVPPPVEPCP